MRAQPGRSVLAPIFGALILVYAGAAAHADALARLVQQGTQPGLAKRAARHVRFGLPSAASKKDRRDLLLVRNGYVLSYNGDRNALNWASWNVDAQDLGSVGRARWVIDPKTKEQISAFRHDPTLPKSMAVIESQDYLTDHGYTRGHMVRSGERTATERENQKTFYFTNMLPQSVNNNNGPWNRFEDYYRELVQADGYSAHVIAGGIFGPSPVQARKVAVPSETWKIVALLKKGQDLSHVDEHTRVIAIRMPNDNTNIKVTDGWEGYRTSVADLEKATGLRFLDEVPQAVAQQLKAKVDQTPVAPFSGTSVPLEEKPHENASQVLASKVRGKVRWYSPDRGRGYITLADGTELFFHKTSRVTTVRDGEDVELDVLAHANGQQIAGSVRSLHPRATPLGNP